MSSVQERVGRANPVPVADAALTPDVRARILELVESRTPTDLGSPVIPPRRWSALAPLAVATLGLIVALVGLNRGSDVSSLETASPPDVVAMAYIEARNDFDASAVTAFLAPDAGVQEYPLLRDVTELEAAFRYLEIIDEQLSFETCSTAASSTEVTCEYLLNNRLTRRLGTTGVRGSMRFRVENGKIVELSNDFDYATYEARVLDAFISWLDNTRDGGFRSSFQLRFLGEEVQVTPRLDRLDLVEVDLEEFAPAGRS